jgi:exodeoxyribonuclease VII large subunit
VALLPDRRQVQLALQQQRRHLEQLVALRLQGERQRLGQLGQRLLHLHPKDQLQQRRLELHQASRLLRALSPQHVLERGFSLVRHPDGSLVRRLADLEIGMRIGIDLVDGHADAVVGELRAQARRGAD